MKKIHDNKIDLLGYYFEHPRLIGKEPNLKMKRTSMNQVEWDLNEFGFGSLKYEGELSHNHIFNGKGVLSYTIQRQTLKERNI